MARRMSIYSVNLSMMLSSSSLLLWNAVHTFKRAGQEKKASATSTPREDGLWRMRGPDAMCSTRELLLTLAMTSRHRRFTSANLHLTK
jgi:hypothetical protein